MNRLILVNQAVGPFYLSLIREISASERFDSISLITGTYDPEVLKELRSQGVEVNCCASYNNTKMCLRLLTWLLFSLQVVAHVIKEMCLGQRLNTLWLFSSNPPILSPLLSLLQLTRFIKYYYFVLDIYPAVLISSGTLKLNSAFYRIWETFDRIFVERTSKVLTLDKGMKSKLISLYPSLIDEKNIDVIPLELGIHSKAHVKREDNFIAQDLGYNDNDLVIGYAGNLGVGHDFSFLFSREIKLDHLNFIFIGGGAQYPKLKGAFNDNYRFQFRSFYPHESLDCVISLPDISIITIEDNSDSLMIPSKFYSCVAYGVPVLFIGPANHHLAEIVRKFNLGFTVVNGDIRNLNKILVQLNRAELSVAFKTNFNAYIASLNHIDLGRIF